MDRQNLVSADLAVGVEDGADGRLRRGGVAVVAFEALVELGSRDVDAVAVALRAELHGGRHNVDAQLLDDAGG